MHTKIVLVEVVHDIAGCKLARAFKEVVRNVSCLPPAIALVLGVVDDLREHDCGQSEDGG